MLRPEELPHARCEQIVATLIRRHKLVRIDPAQPGVFAWPLAVMDAALDVVHAFAPDASPSAADFARHWGFTAGPFLRLPTDVRGLDFVALAVHEVGHGDQFYRAIVTGDRLEDTRAPFVWSYLVSAEARARFEADRYAAQGEFLARIQGWDAARWAAYIVAVRDQLLPRYLLSDDQRTLAAEIMDGRAASIIAGSPCLDTVCAEALELVRAACAETP